MYKYMQPPKHRVAVTFRLHSQSTLATPGCALFLPLLLQLVLPMMTSSAAAAAIVAVRLTLGSTLAYSCLMNRLANGLLRTAEPS